MAGETTPTPDPTILTTEQILREVESATKLLQAEVQGLKQLHGEKFESVRTQFSLVESRRVEQKADTEKAVAAALSAAKEAVTEQTAASEKSITKSETATAEQIKQLAVTGNVADGALSDTLADLKTRVERIESGRQALTESRNEQRLNVGAVVGIAGAGVGFLSLVAAVVFFAATH